MGHSSNSFCTQAYRLGRVVFQYGYSGLDKIRLSEALYSHGQQFSLDSPGNIYTVSSVLHTGLSIMICRKLKKISKIFLGMRISSEMALTSGLLEVKC